MSVQDESGPIELPRHVAPRPSVSEKPERRLSTVRATKTPADRINRAPTPEEFGHRFARSAPSSVADDAENAFFESLRRPMDPEMVPEPQDAAADWVKQRRMFLTVGGVAALFGIAIGAVMIFVSTASTPSAKGAPTAAEMTSSLTQQQASEAGKPDALKPAALQPQSPPASNKGDQLPNRQESERALQQFMQWRQKVDSSQTSR